MQNYTISLALALLLGVIVLMAFFLFQPRGDQNDITALKEELVLARRELATLDNRMGHLEKRLAELASKPASPPREPTPPPPGEAAASTPTSPPSRETEPAAFKEAVFALIAEERRNRDEERRRRAEELRKEIEEMRHGPYDRFNLKVNSMTKALGLNDTQRDQYFEITKRSWELLQNARTGIDWRSKEGRTRYQEAQEEIQKDYAAAVEQLLTPEQLKRYGELAPWSRSIQNLGRILEPGETRVERAGALYPGGGQTFRIGGPRAR